MIGAGGWMTSGISPTTELELWLSVGTPMQARARNPSQHLLPESARAARFGSQKAPAGTAASRAAGSLWSHISGTWAPPVLVRNPGLPQVHLMGETKFHLEP